MDNKMYSEIKQKKNKTLEDFNLNMMQGIVTEIKPSKVYTMRDGVNCVNNMIYMSQQTMVDGAIVNYNKKSIAKIQYREKDGAMEKMNYSNNPKWEFDLGDKILIIYDLKVSVPKSNYENKDEQKIFANVNILYANNLTKGLEFRRDLPGEEAVRVLAMIQNVLPTLY
jgi:hypothetical protein